MILAALTGDQVVAFVLLDLTVILLAARLCGAIARRLGQPAVVGEIIAGVLLGPTLLGRTTLAWDRPWSALGCTGALEGTDLLPSITTCLFPPQARGVLGAIGQLALLLFMFLVGVQLDLAALRGRLAAIGTVAVTAVLLPVALAVLAAPILVRAPFVPTGADAPSSVAATLLIGALLAVTALPVAVRILQEKGLEATPLGLLAIASAAVVTVLMFMLVALARGLGSGIGVGGLLVRFALIGAYLAVMLVVVRPLLAPLGRAVEAREREAVGPRPAGMGVVMRGTTFALLIALLFLSGAVAQALGLGVIVGGFMAGVALPARTMLARDLEAELSDVTIVVLLPVFLAFAGLQTDFTTLGTSAILGLVVLLVLAIGSKLGAGLLGGRLAGLSREEGTVLGVLLNCRGLLVIVVALAGVDAGLITGPLQVGGVLVALVTTAMTGPLVDRTIAAVAHRSPTSHPIG